MNKITLTSDQLKRVFEVAQSAISKDVVRPVLQYAKATIRRPIRQRLPTADTALTYPSTVARAGSWTLSTPASLTTLSTNLYRNTSIKGFILSASVRKKRSATGCWNLRATGRIKWVKYTTLKY